MLEIFNIVLPVFVLVGAGYAAVRTKIFPNNGTDALLAFTVRIATPCLLFRAMYLLEPGEAFEWRMLFSFYTGVVVCFLLGIAIARMAGRRPGEAVAVGFGAAFSNSLMLGLPIMLRAYGEGSAAPVFGILALHAPLIYAMGIIAMEVSRRDGAGVFAAIKRVIHNISRNALMIGIALGLLLNFTDLRLPEPIFDAVSLLASAAVPSALFGLGAALTRYRVQEDFRLAAMITALGVGLHPAIAWLLADVVFQLDIDYVRSAVVVAAMPAGLNVYIFASMYKRSEGVAASTVLISTAVSIVTVSLWLLFLGGAGMDAG